jgi:branched-chain amino acid transport system substrate-binding protein
MKVKYTILIIILILISLIVSCSFQKKKPILLGVIYNLHGGLASLGVPSSHGAKLAIDKINASGGINGHPIQMILKDGYTNGDTIRTETKNLIDRKVVTIIGFNDSDQVLYAQDLINKAAIPYITPGSTAPILVKKIPKYLFLGCWGDNVQAAAGAEFAKTGLNYQRAVLITNQNTEYTRYLSKYFKESWLDLGGSLNNELSYSVDPNDSIRIIKSLKIQKKNFDFIYLSASPPDVGPWVKLIRKAGITQPILGGDGYDTPLLVKIAGNYADNVYFSTHAWMNMNGSNEQMRDFFLAYRQKYGVDPENSFAALAYDAIMLFADAATRAKKIQPSFILEAIQNTTDFSGLTGKMKYINGSHIPAKEVMIIKISKEKPSLEAVIMPEKIPNP